MITKPYNHTINLSAEVLVEFKSGAEGSSSKRWGGCGVDYIESENYAITTGMKPWVVEIRIDKGKLNIPHKITKEIVHANYWLLEDGKALTRDRDNDMYPYSCLGTILSPRHILSAAACFCHPIDQNFRLQTEFTVTGGE